MTIKADDTRKRLTDKEIADLRQEMKASSERIMKRCRMMPRMIEPSSRTDDTKESNSATANGDGNLID